MRGCPVCTRCPVFEVWHIILYSLTVGAGPKNTMHVLYILYGSNLHIYPHLFAVKTPAFIARALTAHVTIICVECQVLCMVVCVGVQFVQGIMFAGCGHKKTLHIMFMLQV